MANGLQYAVVWSGLLVCVLGGGGSKVTQSDDGSSGTISFSTPDLNDEEGHSPWMPDALKCDACRVVALQLFDKFEAFNKVQKHYKYNIPESEILDIAESVCEDKSSFENYGVKQVSGENRLSGPGLTTADEPGIMAGGGRWPGRLMDMCEQYMGQVGEVEVYNAFKQNPKSRRQFEDFLCRGKGLLGYCLKRDTGDAPDDKDEL